ncbi:MAG: phenylalanine--tRNA ligase subunit alpha [Defluviitoga tunisiensis]|jgi:phenylalanyl-tRNA synthetase alpha chain|uniref:Phenylalanine--tRNA ligase alpha subunit n=1 Tax=Defluviitoga tunisiensis TaxID=1006576 RepID=A0A0C7NHZ0_DEFTU|nr:phenylalanine--tRNA ligase subunit alpha [Defluviitoga tunisiensis]MDD3600507.1 phenylalanine--tRNA ligase subunit alpha [Defluviitoga tunisiensis]MDY0379779.1 phenylalanine--tRNA ligase subunit alpha [Defluviitoga tunisiensis]CEP77591.1 Phenylalanine-tRNA ligase alpha subunit [Defluviitoga tunisiensis]HHV01499.1 phenylalanine--tRNA ligase subunit alpha [Defluviitoga tunisiensis]HOB55304.1 phenylalanine--tRNA ligase subunit alpha [Defluviitoga tunisiensis]
MNHNIKDIEEIAKELKNELEKIDDYQSFQNLKSKYLGKNGIIKSLMKNLKELDEEQRKNFGKNINELKNIIEEFFEEKLIILKEKERLLKEKESWIDVTIPGSKRKIGKISLISKTIRDIEEIFVGMGFSVAEGPEIENSWYNFDALNTPEWHPAREMQDTFYLSNDKKYLLRTHTSPVQIRTMLSNKPPLAIISPGRVYRKDELDATHSPVFHQVEGLFIDKNVSIAHIKMYLEYLAKKLFGDKVTILLRPSYFPFTEPSFEVDISCIFCEGKGCNICKNSGWIEILGAGLVHPNVLKSVHYDPDVWQGFAFGMGVERIALLKYNVPEMREFYKNDIRFIEI